MDWLERDTPPSVPAGTAATPSEVSEAVYAELAVMRKDMQELQDQLAASQQEILHEWKSGHYASKSSSPEAQISNEVSTCFPKLTQGFVMFRG